MCMNTMVAEASECAQADCGPLTGGTTMRAEALHRLPSLGRAVLSNSPPFPLSDQHHPFCFCLGTCCTQPSS